MSFIPIGAVYEGNLNLWGSNYQYVLEIPEVFSDKFNFMHSIFKNDIIIDKKTGEGFIKLIDVNFVKLEYQDPETDFEGLLNINTQEISGKANMKSSVVTGDFSLKLKEQTL